MEKYGLCYEDAFTLVRSKRRFIGPNIGFVAQLKLFGHMEYRLNRDDPRFKQFRLKMAGQKLKQGIVNFPCIFNILYCKGGNKLDEFVPLFSYQALGIFAMNSINSDIQYVYINTHVE
jgi:hypothetical protein